MAMQLHRGLQSNTVVGSPALVCFKSRPCRTQVCCRSHVTNAEASRRDLLAICTFAACGLLAPANAVALETPSISSLAPTAPVMPALSAPKYVERIIEVRPAAWEELTSLIGDGRFKEASEALVLYPFDDVAQSAFFLPWAMLMDMSVDEQQAVKVQDAYSGFEDRLMAFRRVCREAASYRAEDEEVEAKLGELSTALDTLLESAMVCLSGRVTAV